MQSVLTSALAPDEWSHSCFCCLTPGERTPSWMGGPQNLSGCCGKV